jgi:hypothetical protein
MLTDEANYSLSYHDTIVLLSYHDTIHGRIVLSYHDIMIALSYHDEMIVCTYYYPTMIGSWHAAGGNFRSFFSFI